MRPMPVIRITAEDILRCDSPWRDYEIWDGIPILHEPCGGRSSHIGVAVSSRLFSFATERELGWTFGADQGFLLARNPDRLLEPDGAFVSKLRLPMIPERDFLELAPDFVIEVRSPTDAWEAVVEKCGIWLAHGVQCAWAIDPLARKAAVFRPGTAPELVPSDGSLQADPALDGFEVPMAALLGGLT